MLRELAGVVLLSLICFTSGTEAANGAPYNVPDAKRGLDFSAAAYCPADRITSWNCDTCVDHPGVEATVFYNETTDTQAFVAWDPANNTVWVVFRGTDPLSIKNWITDLKFPVVADYSDHCSGCKVHEGFLTAYNNVQPGIVAKVQSLLAAHPTAALFVSGHSLGAALAALCSTDLYVILGKAPTHTYTYGQPRVGNDAFYKFFDNVITAQSSSYRVTHFADPVPHLPLEIMGFHHTATEVFYNELETHYTVCDGSGEDSLCADGVLFPLNVLDHLTYMGLNFTFNFINCKL